MTLVSRVYARRSGKTALAWLWLKMRGKELGLPIECADCRQPHDTPPALGRCPCGSYLFGVGYKDSGQAALDFHAEIPDGD